MDELSIDSATNEKTTMSGTDKNKKRARRCSPPPPTTTSKFKLSSQSSDTQPTINRPHFAIDWRQLTYYQKDTRSYLGRHRALASSWLGGKTTQPGADGEPSTTTTTTTGVGRCHEAGEPFGGHRKRILNSLDGCFRSGQLSAILGPSGAGKTTFLSALFGNKQEQAYGSTKVSWFSDAQHSQPLAGWQHPKRPIRIAFLPQHDHLLHHLSVYETLMFASKIKNVSTTTTTTTTSTSTSTSTKKRHNFHRHNVKRVAKMLKLTECLETRCGKLSGGQYKRVSIGQELLSEPDVIILDEPTSGLDAMTCLTTIRTLKSIVTRHPMSIILTIHQPDQDVFNLFDQVYVIAQGGMAIYEGSPRGIAATLASAVGLHMPRDNYNPARFIVENAFLFEGPPEGAHEQVAGDDDGASGVDEELPSSSDDDDDDDDDDQEGGKQCTDEQRNDTTGAGLMANNRLMRSLASLTEAIAGKESPAGGLRRASGASKARLRDSGRRPLLNIGIQTADGHLITSKQLQQPRQPKQAAMASNRQLDDSKRRLERYNLLRRLNELQRAKYYPTTVTGAAHVTEETSLQKIPTSTSTSTSASKSNATSDQEEEEEEQSSDCSSTGSSYVSTSNTAATKRVDFKHSSDSVQTSSFISASSSSSGELEDGDGPTDDDHDMEEACRQETKSPSSGINSDCCSYSIGTNSSLSSSSSPPPLGVRKLKRHFDKRLSAKHNNAKQTGHPLWLHTYLLAHRTWLSIIRDPVFFGIQFVMHTTIPILLALIFGSSQEEGCPRLGHFDLVEFAYADTDDFIHSTVHSVRRSIGNIGVVFFEMFVLSFAINCITALVFPSDMFVLLKEYRNGWYSLSSYFFGRTLADLPVPVVLHSMAMAILYYMTGQPLAAWRFLTVIGIVVLASLVAQSVGLTIGALLMRSSQSAVLAAAGIVAPFFALSGFIVRIHTLRWVAQLGAQASYLYHLLNGFIIMRYGFQRCPCKPDDFEPNESHQIPANLHTMASIWIGTFSEEFASSGSSGGIQQLAANDSTSQTIHSRAMQRAQMATNKTQNIDPNIDVVDKIMNAFRMANTYGHKVDTCDDVLPYAMLDFNLRDQDIWWALGSLLVMLLVSRVITFSAIYYKVRSFS